MIDTAPITRQEIEAARKRIAADVRRTPLLRLRGSHVGPNRPGEHRTRSCRMSANASVP